MYSCCCFLIHFPSTVYGGLVVNNMLLCVVGVQFRVQASLVFSFVFRKSESVGSEKRKSQSISPSPEKEDRFYMTRGSVVGCEEKENGHMNGFSIGIGGDNEGGVTVFPRFFVSLSNKRSKHIQKCIFDMVLK
ncbi:uncharacterized protein A4U43_C03F22120 [Asparagus officinalis]|uniref:Uncharacterized protein n=1 Tax=Asparagus officinalis TaxID=4686 RepID=A0A5P1FC36_ASPOF|nr:uncharacterized protein A4U43_C03F22120 [Asparagus officinalis]